jgi:hypothetical protein
MIGLLRRIRRRLLESESTRKSLLYATGEVVLVVTGILIALQLNTWREARKDRAFELTMLREIHAALTRDVRQFNIYLDRLDISEDGSNRVLHYRLRHDAPADSLAGAIGRSRTWILLSANRGPYDALKTTGLDRISNDSLRVALISVYDYWLPRTTDFVGRATAQFDRVKPLHDALFRPTLENGPDDVPRITSVFSADAHLLDANLPVLVAERLSATHEARRRLEPLRDHAVRLLELLEAELRLPPAPRVREDTIQ